MGITQSSRSLMQVPSLEELAASRNNNLAVSATLSKVSITNAFIIANGKDRATIKVLLVDNNGNPVPNFKVSLSDLRKDFPLSESTQPKLETTQNPSNSNQHVSLAFVESTF